MQIPGVHVETLHNPARYTPAQIDHAIRMAAHMNRGKLVLCTLPLGNRDME